MGARLLPLLPKTLFAPEQQTKVQLWNLNFPNCLGLAAGADKNGVAIRTWQHLGLGWMELGTVTKKAQIGNPRPRVWKFPQHQAIVNYLGLPNQGVDVLVDRIKCYRRKYPQSQTPIAVSVASNTYKVEEEIEENYRYCINKVSGLADLIVVNLSCPNLNSKPLQAQQKRMLLKSICRMRTEAWNKHHNSKERHQPPVLAKVSPDEPLHQLFGTIDQSGVDGVIATNTTVCYDHASYGIDRGGLSGEPLFEKSLKTVTELSKAFPKLPIVATGGISTCQQALKMREAGAKLLQIYTGLVFNGPRIIKRIVESM